MDLLDYAAAARLLCVRKGTLYSMVSQRQVPFIRIAPRIVRFDRETLEKWVAARSVVPARPNAVLHDEPPR